MSSLQIRFLLPLGFLVLAGFLSACGVAVGAGATAGVAASQERGLGTAIDDTAIKARIAKTWLEVDSGLFVDLTLKVHEGRVLITGKVVRPQDRLEAVRLAWREDGVRQVIDEIQVTDEGGVADFTRDTWITTQMLSKITFDSQILSINYSVQTVNGVVYLMGVAQNREEVDRAMRYARNIAYVKKVVDHMRIKSQPLPPLPDRSSSSLPSLTHKAGENLA